MSRTYRIEKEGYMKIFTVFGLTVLIFTMVMALPSVASEGKAMTHKYVGVEACRMCHENQYKMWESSAHAKAYDALKAKEKTNPQCLPCHTTDGTSAFPNVQCEACHGPGSDYSDMDTMKNFNKVWGAGLNRHAADTCVNCHSKKSPTFKGFDFKTYWMEIMH